MHHNHLRRSHTTTNRHLRLSVRNLARHLALHAPDAAQAFKQSNLLRHPDALQRALQHPFRVHVVNQRKTQARPDEARRAAITALRLLRNRAQMARPAARAVDAIAHVFKAPERRLRHRHRRRVHQASHDAWWLTVDVCVCVDVCVRVRARGNGDAIANTIQHPFRGSGE